MSMKPAVVTVQCLSLREYFSSSNIKSMVRGFVYEYETPKIVTIHSISSKQQKKYNPVDLSRDKTKLVSNDFVFSFQSHQKLEQKEP